MHTPVTTTTAHLNMLSLSLKQLSITTIPKTLSTSCSSILCTRSMDEKGARQSTDTPPQEPIAEEDAWGDVSKIKGEYEEILATKSATAEDVSVKDNAPSSLGKTERDREVSE